MSDFVINGTTVTLDPTSFGWVPREAYGKDGNGHPIYPAVREFQIEWGIVDISDWQQIQSLFDTLHITGSAVVEIPAYDSATYEFREYSGCVVEEPQFERYFTQHPTAVRLLISNIRT